MEYARRASSEERKGNWNLHSRSAFGECKEIARGPFIWNACKRPQPRVRCTVCGDIFAIADLLPANAAQTPRLMMKVISVCVDGDYLRASFTWNNIAFYSFVSESTMWFWQNDSYCFTDAREKERARGETSANVTLIGFCNWKRSHCVALDTLTEIHRLPIAAKTNEDNERQTRNKLARNDIVADCEMHILPLANLQSSIAEWIGNDDSIDRHRHRHTPTNVRNPLTFSTVCFNSSVSNPASSERWFTMTK